MRCPAMSRAPVSPVSLAARQRHPRLIRGAPAGSRARHAAAPVRASQDDRRAETGLTVSEALQLLGVREGASAEDIITAKKQTLARVPGEAAKVEAAYDILLMQSLSRRRQGVVADSSVRYADAKPAAARPAAAPSQPRGAAPTPDALASWAAVGAKALPALGSPPDERTLAQQGGVFAAAAVWALALGVSHPLGAPDVAPGAPLALGAGAALYFLRNKGLPLPRAAALATAGLLAGALLGTAVQGGLRVDIVPLGPLSSPATLVSEFALVGLFAASALLV